MKAPKIILMLIGMVFFAWLLIKIGLPANWTKSLIAQGAKNTTTKDTQPEFCTDASGNRYKTVKIGTQTWMAEDLRNAKTECKKGLQLKFTNGLERGPGVAFYDRSATPRYAFYNNQQSENSGIIYNYNAIQHCAICPEGFRIPTQADWDLLVEHLGGRGNAGKRLLLGGDSDFNALLNGRIDAYGSVLKGNIGFWWSGDLVDSDSPLKAAYTFEINNLGVIKLKGQDIRVGNYVRCIKE